MAGAKKWFKKRSKRIPTKLRVKAEKKLREHNRKVGNMLSVHEVQTASSVARRLHDMTHFSRACSLRCIRYVRCFRPAPKSGRTQASTTSARRTPACHRSARSGRRCSGRSKRCAKGKKRKKNNAGTTSLKNQSQSPINPNSIIILYFKIQEKDESVEGGR